MKATTRRKPISKERVQRAHAEITDHLENGIIKFWLKNGIDKEKWRVYW